jgi:hypothetical protein
MEPKMLRILTICLLSLIVVAWRSSPSADVAIATDHELHAFAGWASGMSRPLFVIGQRYRDGAWRDAKWLCTTFPLYATEKYIYFLTVAHCVEPEANERILQILARDLPLEKTEYKPAGSNTVRLLRGENVLGIQGQLIPIQDRWEPGMRTFVLGQKRLGDKIVPVVSTGYVATAPGWEAKDDGDILHTAPSWFGWSGGGVFVYNTRQQRFALIGLTEGVMSLDLDIIVLLSDFFFAYSIPKNILDYIKSDSEASSLPPSSRSHTLSSKGRFANFDQLPQAVQDAWAELYTKNASYELVPFTAVRIEGQLWPIGPKERVQNAWLHDRLKAKGKLQDVDWSEFLYTGGL